MHTRGRLNNLQSISSTCSDLQKRVVSRGVSGGLKLIYCMTAIEEQFGWQMVEAKKNERANALKEVKRLCKEFGFTAGMLKGSLAEGRRKN